MKLKTVLLLALLCAPAFAQMTPVQGNITAASSSCLSTNCVTLQLDGQTGAASIQLAGTFALTAQFEVSNDNATTYVNINCTPPNSTTAVSSATATGLWQCNVAGFTHIRVRGSAYTSGTAAVVINSARVSAKSGGGTSLPALSDNGTVIASTERFVGPTSSTVAQLSDTATNGSGWAISGANIWGLSSSSRVIGLVSTTEFRSGSGLMYSWSSNTDPGAAGADTAFSRGAGGIVNVGTGAAASSAGTVNAATFQYRGLAQTYFVTSDFTTSGSGTALEAITGLTWTFPATTAINARVDCNILYFQNVANVAVAFGFQDATVAPTNLAASGIQYTSATASTEGTTSGAPGTAATAVTSATPSAITTIWHAQLHLLIEQPSNASTSAFTIRVSTATAADTVTVKRGSYCTLAQ